MEAKNARTTGFILIADQAVSVLTNFGSLFLLIQLTDVGDLGRSSLFYSVYQLAIGGMRAGVLEPALFSAGDLRLDISRGLAPISARLSALLMVVVGGVALFLVPPSLVLIALCLGPAGLIAQDTYRYSCFLQSRPVYALYSDCAWLVAFAATAAALNAAGRLSPPTLISAWALSSWAGVSLPWLADGVRRWRVRSKTLDPNRVRGTTFGAFALTALSGEATFILLAATVPAPTLGGIRLMSLLGGIPRVVVVALSAFFAGKHAESWQLRENGLGVLKLQIAAQVAISALYGIILFSLPVSFIRRLFGVHAEGLISVRGWALAMALLFSVSSALGIAGKRTPPWIVFRNRLVLTVLLVPGVVIGARTWGTAGFALAYIVHDLVLSVLLWGWFVRTFEMLDQRARHRNVGLKWPIGFFVMGSPGEWNSARRRLGSMSS